MTTGPTSSWPGGPTPQAVAERVRTLELQVTRRLDSLLHGAHEGLTPGHGTDLGESRPYVPGDEVRRIDWNVTARTSQVHVRNMVAERELTTWLVVDLDANMRFGTRRHRKGDLACAAIATIGFLNVRDSNRLGALLMAGPARRLFPPRPGRDHVRAILSSAMAAPPVEGHGHTDLGEGLHRVLAAARHRGMVVLVSDLRGGRLPDDLARATLHHDVLVVQVRDRRDVDLPDVGLLSVVDPATATTREVVVTPKVRAAYRRRATTFQDDLTSEIRAAGADHLVLDTGEDWLATIANHVRRRRHLPLPRRHA